jgi:hypothetical protein
MDIIISLKMLPIYILALQQICGCPFVPFQVSLLVAINSAIAENEIAAEKTFV